ncbi:hypothetical protein SUGI_0331930 [Cryptomeria japonica]|uniref:putative receptor-like protein kinase At1g80870 n=1 Tax=Cryptomeria japonica TaxID=3369 RepID=UPI0024089D61|nr:putative receptor-like protein kinase At1g80870 [Cryptomeria japonica]GLJ18626.1 hypothetical protein SUGI_0331930 [Cryptomeria japonica]
MVAASTRLGPILAPSPSPWGAPFSYSSHHHFQALALGFAALGLGMLVLVIFFIYYSRLRSNRTSPYDLTADMRLQRFSYGELKTATNSFNDSNKLGKGGFGVVYKGVLSNGKEVAVKKLDVSSQQGEREFQNEMSIIAGLHSPFIVSLLGYCSDGNKRRLLVYDHMQKGSLQEALFENNDDSKLDWEKRYNIILDVAQALAFLHLECDPPIIHGDVKPSNVLLDNNFKARIADFGLARLKSDDMYYVDMFNQSQELWKSQDLLKSQELSRIVAGRDSKSGASDDDESSHTNINRNPKESPGKVMCIEDNVAIDVMDEQHTRGPSVGVDELDAKGKEIVSEHLGVAGCEDWMKMYPSEEGTDWSKELQDGNIQKKNFWSKELQDGNIQKKNFWSKDWWGKHDGSGALSTMEYIMQWIGSQRINHKIKKTKKMRKRPSPDEETVSSQTESRRKTKGKKGKEKTRKIKEWWKEEYFAEMSKKSRKLEKIKWKSSSQRFDRGRNSVSRRDFLWDKIRRDSSCSMGSEMWSGDLLSRDLSSTTSMRGTVCYVPPEYGGCGFLSEKGDIYSFGVLMLVIVSGRRPLHVLASPMKDFEKANLISWARHLAQTGNTLDLVSDSLKGSFDKDQASLCITLGILCLQRIPETRPDISDILKILRGEMDAPSLPLEFSPSPPSRIYNKSKKRPQSDTAAPSPVP